MYACVCEIENDHEMSYLWVCILSDYAVCKCCQIESVCACENTKVHSVLLQKVEHLWNIAWMGIQSGGGGVG